MQKNSKNKYSKLSTPIISKGRFFSEKKSLLRSSYQRDRDRIIHSTAFRRLKHKTQVFVNTTDDHYRTRITHSLEVAQIARTLAKYFNLNEDLCETLSLAHDLGHTPFGHAGEVSLNECMRKYGGFDHNIQTVRIVTLLENKYYNFKGLNLSIETLDGLKAGLFNLKDLNKIPTLSNIVKKHNKKIRLGNKELVLRQIVREIINVMVKDIIVNTKKNIISNNIKSINDVYNADKQLVCFSNKIQLFDISIKKFLREKMYYSNVVIKKTNKGKRIIKKLFLMIKKNPHKYIKKKNIKKDSRERMICDFIAGMTDRFAINLYNKIK